MALTKHNFLHFIYLEFGLGAGKSWLAVLFFWLISVLRWLRQKVSQHNVYFKEETIISKLELMKMGTKRRRMKMDPSERTVSNLMWRSQPHSEEIPQTVANSEEKS
ncbi:hypothetical protein SO802_034442 [Lithocarpus litseifolius]|uniref:Uncharacterized protein n=1 Tax=Lithocarpus litseifolius TaxID=425828 RepID=A0AAW2BI73_9ROSI